MPRIILLILAISHSRALPAAPHLPGLGGRGGAEEGRHSIRPGPLVAAGSSTSAAAFLGRGETCGRIGRLGKLETRLRGGCGIGKAIAPSSAGSSSSSSSSAASWQPSEASDLHDNVNLGALVGLGGGAVYALAAGADEVHRLLTVAGFAYILLDSLWLYAIPSIVKSPGTVLAHHIATLLVLLDPLLQPKHAMYTSACLLVEINTFLLLLRRKLHYSIIVELPFVATWVMLRNVWYPLLMVYFMHCAAPSWTFKGMLPRWLADLRSSLEGANPEPMLAASMVSWAAICVFQFKWTIQLFSGHPWFGGRSRARAKAASREQQGKKGFL